jgi:hypothetical protein
MAGPLLAAVAMANVAALNLGFDIPVKIFSIHLFLMAVYLLVPGLRRLGDVLLLGRAVPPVPRPLRASGWRRVCRLSVKTAIVLYMAGSSLQTCLAVRHWRLERSPLFGIYEVVEFSQNDEVRPPLTTDPARWRRVVFQFPGSMAVQRMDDSFLELNADYDGKGALSVAGSTKSAAEDILKCVRETTGGLRIEGTFRGQQIAARLSRVDESKFPLSRSQFHWMTGME